MLERDDLNFAQQLEREILRRLNGTQDVHGLFRTVLGCANWDAFMFTKGSILTYEEVLKLMREIARRMNTADEESQRQQAPRIN
jgi:hypothetical protein